MDDDLTGIFEGSGLGLTRGVVRIVPSGPEWSAAFDRLIERMRPALPDEVVAIEHVGSTAVPELPAKPILDVAVGVRAGADPGPSTAAMEALGFLYRGDFEGDELDRVFGLEGPPRTRLVNAHMVAYDGPRWRAYLLFRDRLRTDPAARAEYAEVKNTLAARHPEDRPAYVAGKDAVVARLVNAPGSRH